MNLREVQEPYNAMYTIIHYEMYLISLSVPLSKLLFPFVFLVLFLFISAPLCMLLFNISLAILISNAVHNFKMGH